MTINAVPHRVLAGEPVLVFGQLRGSDDANQTIRLYHRVNPFRGYSLVSTTHTDATGHYSFPRAEGVVLTNREWYVRGPDGTHSRTIRERVDALVSLSATPTAADTRQTVVFTGRVFPEHPFERVVLQEQIGASDDWHSLKSSFTGLGSEFRIAYRWRVPGVHAVRVVFPGDRYNARGESDPVTITVQQTQVAGFSIASSDPVIEYGASATISGVLDQPGTTTPEPGVSVTLLGRTAGSSSFTGLATTTTGQDGSYSFTQAPTHNTLYKVKTTFAPVRSSAVLFEGVRDDVSINASSTTGHPGDTVTFTGTVLPGRSPGDVVYLQRRGRDGDWHTISVAHLNGASGYSVSTTLGDDASQVFRTRVLGDRLNVGGVSSPVTVSVTPAS